MKTQTLVLTALCAVLMSPPVARSEPLADPADPVNALEALFGAQPGARRSQTKGYCTSGFFTGTADGRELTKAAAFSGAKMPTVVRFSVGGGNPNASDKSRSTHGMALAMTLPDGQSWMQANLSAPVYFVKDPRDFAAFVRARVPDPVTGKPDPERLRAFNTAHPETLRQGQFLSERGAPASFASTPYWGINAFEFEASDGRKQLGRWRFDPEAGEQRLSDSQAAALPDNFLESELRERLAKGPVAFSFHVQLAEAVDDVTDATIEWPSTRTQVRAGRLVIERIEALAACDTLMFNPLILPDGLKPSADPVLLARPAAYGVSFGRRVTEVKP